MNTLVITIEAEDFVVNDGGFLDIDEGEADGLAQAIAAEIMKLPGAQPGQGVVRVNIALSDPPTGRFTIATGQCPEADYSEAFDNTEVDRATAEREHGSLSDAERNPGLGGRF